MPAEGGAWDTRVSRRFAGLALVRVVAQVVGLVWFLVAARRLTDAEYGLLATGLTFFAVFAGIGDVGTTRGVVRHVAAHPLLLRPVVRQATVLRVGGGAVSALLGVAVVAFAAREIPASVILLAGAVATASGVTELAYAALRCIGRVKVEMVLLVAERLAFLVAGLIALHHGAGAVGLLVVYLVTNLLSAVAGLAAVGHFARGLEAGAAGNAAPLPTWSLTDGEARFTAVGFALVTVSPRVAPVLLSLLASAAAVGAYSVAQRPIEAVTLFALSSAAPLFPLVRERIAGGRDASAADASSAMTAALAIGAAPLLTWCVVSPSMLLELLFGTGRYEDAALVLRLLAVTSLTWAFRGVAELVLLARERAREFLMVMAIGMVATVVVAGAAALAGRWTPVAAAWSVVAAEVVMTALLVRLVPSLVDAVALRRYAVVAGVAASTAVLLVLGRDSTSLSIVVVGAMSLVGSVGALRFVRSIEGRA